MANPRSRRVPGGALVVAMLLACLPLPGIAETGGKGTGEERVESKPVQVKLDDQPLLDQDGKTVRFRADVVGDRIVVVDTFFTSCGLICPILGAIMMDLIRRYDHQAGGFHPQPIEDRRVVKIQLSIINSQ